MFRKIKDGGHVYIFKKELYQWGWQVEEAPVSKTEIKDYNTNSSKRKRANDLKCRLLAHDSEKKS